MPAAGIRGDAGGCGYHHPALTIDSQRLHLDDVLKDNPGLSPQLPDIFSNAYRLARADALKETQLDKDIFPLECPWTLDQIREDGFYPD